MKVSGQIKKIVRFTRRNSRFIGLILLGLFIGGGIYVMQTHSSINPAAYKPLLELIAEAESRGNYNAYFSNARNTDLQLTDMTIEEVLAWQEQFVDQGSPSNAAGRYQIISPTLSSLVTELSLTTKEKFDPSTQDTLAIALIERRGAESFIEGQLSREEFAHNLSKEWAALPRVIGDSPQNSYYAGDGLNASQVEVEELLNAIDAFEIEANQH